MRKRAADLASRDGHVDSDDFFMAEQNARLVKNAERYYRSMFESRIESWNLRDQHMVETLDALKEHLGGSSAKIVVWAHNSHLGDARATQMGQSGELNVGQLVRERHGENAVLVGFTTYTGTVTAASDWDGPAERKRVRPALSGSYEALFHETGTPSFLLNLRDANWLYGVLNPQRLERAIGVIYLPESERVSHYFYARLAEQFDAVIHLDQTRAVEPLGRTSQWEAGEVPETFPFAV
jgi:erythromycin esterase-like protein